MKSEFFPGIVVLLVFLAACSEGPARSSYKPVLPVVPSNWQEVMGDPHWRLEWLDEGGAWRKWEGHPGSEAPDISVLCEWTTPVLAWPFWPEKNLVPGIMRPAGGLFPWDASGEKLSLSWIGGVEALFWKELAGAERSDKKAEDRLPWYFDWPRFRELFESENIPETVRQDPWLADWKEIGRKTVQSGFDRRRIVSKKFAELAIPGMIGLWIGSSPFASPISVEPGESLLLNADAAADTWVSAEGILKCSASGWVFIQD
jgi:hypothetical protein